MTLSLRLKSWSNFVIPLMFFCVSAFVYGRAIFIPIFENKFLSYAAFILLFLIADYTSKKITCINNEMINTVVYAIGAFGVYTAISYFDHYRQTIVFFAVMISVLSISVTALALFLIRNHRVSLKNKLKGFFKVFMVIFSTVALILIFIVFYNNIRYGKDKIPSSVLSYYTNDMIDIDEDKNIERISTVFFDDVYDQMSLEAKVSLCQNVVNLECEHLGVEKVRVFTSDINKDVPKKYFRIGYYDDEGKKIMIDSHALSILSGEKMIESLLHESYHVLQLRMIDALENDVSVFDNDPEKLMRTQMYRQESENYINGLNGDDFEAYQRQFIEEDARVYAKFRKIDYYQSIDQ